MPFGSTDKCKACAKTVYFIELVSVDGVPYHKTCFRCSHCNGLLVVNFLSYHSKPRPESSSFFFLENAHGIHLLQGLSRKKEGRHHMCAIVEDSKMTLALIYFSPGKQMQS